MQNQRTNFMRRITYIEEVGVYNIQSYINYYMYINVHNRMDIYYIGMHIARIIYNFLHD